MQLWETEHLPFPLVRDRINRSPETYFLVVKIYFFKNLKFLRNKAKMCLSVAQRHTCSPHTFNKYTRGRKKNQ